MAPPQGIGRCGRPQRGYLKRSHCCSCLVERPPLMIADCTFVACDAASTYMQCFACPKRAIAGTLTGPAGDELIHRAIHPTVLVHDVPAQGLSRLHGRGGEKVRLASTCSAQVQSTAHCHTWPSHKVPCSHLPFSHAKESVSETPRRESERQR